MPRKSEFGLCCAVAGGLRYRWKQVSDGGQLPRAGLVIPDPESFQPEAYKPTRFRMRTKFNVVTSMLVSALKAATTSKLASYIQVRASAGQSPPSPSP